MRNHDGCVRAYIRSNKAWYFNPETMPQIEVMFGMYAPDGGTSGEMSMIWHELNGRLVPELSSFDDAWSALSSFHDVIYELGKVDSDNISQENFVEILNKCGFQDFTKYKSPYESGEKEDNFITVQIKESEAIKFGLIDTTKKEIK